MGSHPYWSIEGIEEIHCDGYKVRVYKNRPPNLNEAFRRTIERCPDREAIVSGEVRLTYTQFEEKVDRLASALSERLGIQPGDRVSFLMGNHWRWPLTFMAISRVGAISVPLNNRLQGPELVFQLNNSQSRLLILDEAFLERIEPLREEIKTAKTLVVNGASNTANSFRFHELETFSPRNPDVPRSEEDVACILYTSGTTGLPKGAMLTHRNVISIAMSLVNMLQYEETDRMLFFIPLFHVTGLVGMYIPMILKGGGNIILTGFNRHEVPKVIEEEKITATMGVPATFILMMDSPNYSKYSRATMRSILYGGAPSPPEMYDQLRSSLPEDCIVVDGYGLTEASSNVTISPIKPDRSVLHRHGTIGIPNPLADLRVVDDKGDDAAEGEVGELLVRDPGVMKGYWGAPDKTAEAVREGWLYTGDLVTRDREGYITIKGRKKHMINRGGENIYPVEIENVLYAHPGVLEAAVVGVPDRVMGEEVKVVIVPKEGVTLDENEIRGYLKPRLAGYKIPRFMSFAKELPRNPGGKVMIKDLLEL
ncbi:MAG: class I adenylate-forming enzyme family protein [Pseudomonadota bacterium]